MSLQKLYARYHDKGLVVLGFNTADDKKIALEHLKTEHVTFPNIIDTSETANEVIRKYETMSGYGAVPLTYLIGRDGNVIEAWYGYEPGRAEKALKKLGM